MIIEFSLLLIIGVILGTFATKWLWKSNDSIDAQAKLAQSQGQILAMERQLEEYKQDVEKKNLSILELTTQTQAFKSEKEYLTTQLQNQQNVIEKLNTEMTLKFENLANRILEEKSQKFTDLNSLQIKGFLDPLKEQIKDFEKKVDSTYGNERAERSELKGEIKKLIDLNQKITTEAENLSKALKGDTKTQGTWGEILLENILEKSGLRKGEEYLTQGEGLALKDDSGKHQKPDVIVRLPDNKHIIVDSKMTLVAYEKYAAAQTPEDQDLYAKEHLESLKRHIQGLAGKKYHLNDQLDSPEFTLLFLPLEPAFALAFRLDSGLFQAAWDKQIAIVSPTTLLTTLRTVATIWKQDKMNKNALDIARQSGALYDKLYGFLEDLATIGQRIEQTQKSYEDAVGKFSSGRGNILKQIETLKELGAKTEKSISQSKIGQSLIGE